MDKLTTVLAWAGGMLVAASPFLVWLLKRYIDRTVELRFDLLKAEHGVKFAWQHEQVTKVATEVHEALVEAIQTLGTVAGSGYKVDTGPTEDDIRRLTGSVARLHQAFAKKSMFLPKNIRDCVDKIAVSLGFALNLVLQAEWHRKSSDNEAMSNAMGLAFDMLTREIHPEGQALEPEFRKLLLGEGWGD